MLYYIRSTKEEIYFNQVEGSDIYISPFLDNHKTQIDISDFEMTETQRPTLDLTYDEVEKLAVEIESDVYKHYYKIRYNKREGLDTLKYAKYRYVGYINDIYIAFYFNKDRELSAVELRDYEHELYFYYKGELIFHKYWYKYDDAGFMSQNHNWKYQFQNSWVLDRKIYKREDDFSLFLPDEMDNSNGSFDIFLDSKGLIDNAEYYLQLYKYLMTKDEFHCRSRRAEYKYGRKGFIRWIGDNFDNSKLEEVYKYKENRENDFEYQTLFEFEIDTEGNLNYFKRRERYRKYPEVAHQYYANIIDNEIERILNLPESTMKEWIRSTHNCTKVANRKYLIAKIRSFDFYLTNSLIHIKIRDESNDDNENDYYFPSDW